MKRFAYIDVENTATTTEQMLGFVVDWKKLGEFLKNDKSCSQVFFYTGIEEGDQHKAAEFEALKSLGCCVVRSKLKKRYKKNDKIVTFACTGCGLTNTRTVDMGYNTKANCDVELTVDALENAADSNECFIFSGDGDFEFLARKLMEKKTKVTFVSHAKVYMRAGLPYGRYSKKLRDLVAANPKEISFQEIQNWKFKMQKDVNPGVKP
jgi:uncharacterized LabA/DUF88 family protein